MFKPIAFEINSPELVEIAIHIRPNLKRLEPETHLYGNFLVFGFPEVGRTAVMTPDEVVANFDHIENVAQISLLRFVK